MSERFRVIEAEDAERGANGRILKIRQSLGIEAVGINEFRLGPGETGVEHDETATGDQEVYLVLSGSGVMRIDGEEVELRPGRYLLVEPEATRVPTAGPDGLAFVAVGAPTGRQQIRQFL